MLTGNDRVAQGGRSYTSTDGRPVGSDYDRLGAVQELVKHGPVAVGPLSFQFQTSFTHRPGENHIVQRPWMHGLNGCREVYSSTIVGISACENHHLGIWVGDNFLEPGQHGQVMDLPS